MRRVSRVRAPSSRREESHAQIRRFNHHIRGSEHARAGRPRRGSCRLNSRNAANVLPIRLPYEHRSGKPAEITRGRFAKSAAGPGDNHYFVLGALCHGLFSLKGSRSRVTGSADRRSPSVRPLPGLAGPFRRHTKPFVRRRTCGTRQSRSFENIRDAEFSCSFFKQRDDAVRDTRSSC